MTRDPRALLARLHAAAVQGAAPLGCTREAVHRWCEQHQLGTGARVHVIALGKAAPAMARGALAACQAVGADVAALTVVCAQPPGSIDWGDARLPSRHQVVAGDHPVPGPASLQAAEVIAEAVTDVEADDVVVVLISGGTTALCAAPVPELSQLVGSAERAQAHLANLAQTLLESGLAIHEMNAIRRRVLRFGGGRLAVALARQGARRIGAFAVSDVIGDDPAVIGSGPCSPDPLTPDGLLALIDAHGMRAHLERAVATTLGVEGAGPAIAPPAPDDPAFHRVDFALVAGNGQAVQAMADAARDAGIATVQIAATPLEGEAAALGELLVQQALQAADHGAFAAGPVLWCAGGEPVVHLRETVARALAVDEEADARMEGLTEDGGMRHSAADEPMRGGRMQVLALSAALALEAAAHRGDPWAHRVTVLAAGTDGRDGPTDAAGAITDAAVPALARRGRRTPEQDLVTGRSWYALDAADALLRTGPTGTNVMDVVGLLLH